MGYVVAKFVVALCYKSRVRFPMGSLGFFIDLILPAAQWFWDQLSLYQKRVPGVFPAGQRR